MTLTMIAIMFSHTIFDFVFQSDWMAKEKHKNLTALLIHVLTYTFGVTFTIVILLSFFGLFTTESNISNNSIVIFIIINFLTHLLVDYITSKAVKLCFDKQDYHNGFIIIGFDQFIHIVTLAFTTELYLL